MNNTLTSQDEIAHVKLTSYCEVFDVGVTRILCKHFFGVGTFIEDKNAIKPRFSKTLLQQKQFFSGEKVKFL